MCVSNFYLKSNWHAISYLFSLRLERTLFKRKCLVKEKKLFQIAYFFIKIRIGSIGMYHVLDMILGRKKMVVCT